MMVTILATVLLMAAYFLLLYSGVALIQDKRFFSSAPKEYLALIPDKKRAVPRRACHRLDAGHNRHAAVCGGVRLGRVGRRAERFHVRAVLWAVYHHALLHGNLRYRVL